MWDRSLVDWRRAEVRGRSTHAGYQRTILPDTPPRHPISPHAHRKPRRTPAGSAGGGAVPARREARRDGPGRVRDEVGPGTVEREMPRLGPLDHPFTLGPPRRLFGHPVVAGEGEPLDELPLVLPRPGQVGAHDDV